MYNKEKLFTVGRSPYLNHFVASVCSLHLLFLEGFEYHRQSMILVSPVFCNLYLADICIRNRRGPDTESWGMPLLT